MLIQQKVMLIRQQYFTLRDDLFNHKKIQVFDSVYIVRNLNICLSSLPTAGINLGQEKHKANWTWWNKTLPEKETDVATAWKHVALKTQQANSLKLKIPKDCALCRLFFNRQTSKNCICGVRKLQPTVWTCPWLTWYSYLTSTYKMPILKQIYNIKKKNSGRHLGRKLWTILNF